MSLTGESLSLCLCLEEYNGNHCMSLPVGDSLYFCAASIQSLHHFTLDSRGIIHSTHENTFIFHSFYVVLHLSFTLSLMLDS